MSRLTPAARKEIADLKTRATLLRASAATIRRRRPVEATRKEADAKKLEQRIQQLEQGES